MNRDGILKAAYFACIAIGDEPSVRNVVGMVRKISGKGLRTQDALRWLDSFKRETVGNRGGNARETLITLNSANPETPGKQAGNLRAGVVKELELETTSPNGDGPTSAKASKKTRTGQQSSLPLDLENTIRARQIMELVWARIKPTVGLSIGKTEWGKQNIRFARDLARLGRTDDEISAAIDSHNVKFGIPRTVKAVQTELGYLDAGPAKPRQSPAAGPPVQTIPKADRR